MDDTERRLAERKRVFGDDDNDPLDQDEQYDKAYDKAVRLKELKKEIDKWQAFDADNIADERRRGKKLNALNKERERILNDLQSCALSNSTARLGQSGRRKSQLTEAVEHAYNLLYESGNTELIKPGKIDQFMDYLKDSTTEGKCNENDFISERIKLVEKVAGKWKITMYPVTDSQIVKEYHTGNKETFDKSAVSTILTRSRADKPLPT